MPARAAVDVAHAVASFASERLLRVAGTVLPGQDALTGDYRAGDGRWVRLHMNFAHHRDAALRAVGLPENSAADDLRAAVLAHRAADVESAVVFAGGCASVLRSRDEWLAEPQADAVANAPLLGVVALGPSKRTWAAARAAGDAPLAGVRVLDMTRVIAGPVATRALAALGATVVRVSAPELPQVPQLWVDTGFGKVSVDADLTTRPGADAVRRLAATADVVVQSYRPGALTGRGLGAAEVAGVNPGVVWADISAWGQTGPWASRRGFDSLVQMATGLACPEDGPTGAAPEPLPVQALDHATGWLTAFAVVRALHRRGVDGGGWHVRASLAGTAQWLASLEGAPSPVVDPSGGRCAEMDSEFGTLTYVTPPGAVGDWSLRYAGPPTPPGTHPPVWPDPTG